MITFNKSQIVIEVVSGGYVVQWEVKNLDIGSPRTSLIKTTICTTNERLMEVIVSASIEISINNNMLLTIT